MCEILGCPPSQIKVKFPDMTMADYMFLSAYGIKKMEMEGEMYGFREPRNLLRKTPPRRRGAKKSWAKTDK